MKKKLSLYTKSKKTLVLKKKQPVTVPRGVRVRRSA